MLNTPTLSIRSREPLEYEEELEINSLVTEAARQYSLLYALAPEYGDPDTKTIHFILQVRLGRSDITLDPEASHEAFFEALTTEDPGKWTTSRSIRSIREKFAPRGIEVSLNGGPFILVLPIYESDNLPSEREALILGALRGINIFRGVKLEKCSSQSHALIGKQVIELLFSEEIIEAAIKLIPREIFEFHVNLSKVDPKNSPPTLTLDDSIRILRIACNFLISVLSQFPSELAEEELKEIQQQLI
jgi:hypothetical protein